MKKKYQKRRLKIVIYLTFFPIILWASFEGDTWQRTTPGGNNFFHERCCYGDNSSYSYNVSCKNQNRKNIKTDGDGYIIQNLTKWYFYKNYIVGEYYPIEYKKKNQLFYF